MLFFDSMKGIEKKEPTVVIKTDKSPVAYCVTITKEHAQYIGYLFASSLRSFRALR
jgi:hypothetical protein